APGEDVVPDPVLKQADLAAPRARGLAPADIDIARVFPAQGRVANLETGGGDVGPVRIELFRRRRALGRRDVECERVARSELPHRAGRVARERETTPGIGVFRAARVPAVARAQLEME